MVKIKVGRNILDIDENDLILDNGVCYQIITKEIGYGFQKSTPIMSKKLFKELKKFELIFTNEQLLKHAKKTYNLSNVTFWKFNIKRMQEMGY